MTVSAIKHITVAVDGSPASEAAVRYAHELERAGATLSVCTAEGLNHADAAAKAIAACAQEHASEAIVIGANTRHGFAHARDGMGDDLMRIAGRPVLFIHEADEYRAGDIAVTVSGYDASNLVLDAAIAFATTLGRKLLLITEITVPSGAPYYAPGSTAELRLAEAAKRALAAGVKSTNALGDGIGSIPSSLIELAKRRDCAMIVTGLHDRSSLARFFIGSIAHQLVLEAHVPVAVVHHAAVGGPA